MERTDATGLYARLRRDLLRSAAHHRRARRHQHVIEDVHRSHLLTCQRQLGALRQAYRRTQEAIAWERFKRELERRA
jgi:hypothetical protein